MLIAKQIGYQQTAAKAMSGLEIRCYDLRRRMHLKQPNLPTLIAASKSSVCSGSELHFLNLRARLGRARIRRGNSYRKQ
jgi:hypothetical protein